MNAIYREATPSAPLRIRGGLLDLNRRELIAPDQSRTAFGRVECVLLGRLVESPSEYVSPDELLALLWPDDPTKTHNSVQSVVARVRRILRNLPDGAKLVQTGYGRGYRFVPPRAAFQKPAVAAPSDDVDLRPLVRQLSHASCSGLVVSRRAPARALVAAAIDRLPETPRVRIVDLSGVQSAASALSKIAEAIGANLRGLSFQRTQLKLISQILTREPDTVLVLLRTPPHLAEALAPFRRIADTSDGLRMLVVAAAPIPTLMPEHVEVKTNADGNGTDAVEAHAARALVRALRALDAGEYGQALSFVTDPVPECHAAGLRVELLLARARAERSLGLHTSALIHANEAVSAAQLTALQPLKRRAAGLRDALAGEMSQERVVAEGLRAVC